MYIWNFKLKATACVLSNQDTANQAVSCIFEDCVIVTSNHTVFLVQLEITEDNVHFSKATNIALALWACANVLECAYLFQMTLEIM